MTLRQGTSSPVQPEHASKAARYPIQGIQGCGNITSRALHSEQEVRSFRSMDVSSSQVIQRAFFLGLALRKKYQGKDRRIQPWVKTARHEKWWWNRDPPPLPSEHVLTPAIPTPRGRDVWANPVRAWAQLTILVADRQKASPRISKKSVGRCYYFCDSSVVAKWLYGSYPQGGRAMDHRQA